MTNARQLAARFDASHSPLWCGTAEGRGFDAWLAAFWRGDCPPEPDTCPDAVSYLGGAVRWYEADDAVLGYVPGCGPRCFRVPRFAVEPALDEAVGADGPPCDGDEHDLTGRAPFSWLTGGEAEIVAGR